MARYFDTMSYATPAYKYRMHYEIIFSTTGLAEIQHFYPTNTRMHYEIILSNRGSTEIHYFYLANTRKTYSFSKIIIMKVIPLDEWGISTIYIKRGIIIYNYDFVNRPTYDSSLI